jgi:alpha/beta superfamily hydrolase
MNASTRTLLIAGPAGPIDVALDLPAGPIRGIGLVAHPHPLYGGTRDNKVVQTLARAMLATGYAVWRPNFRGVGATAGEHDHGQGETDDLRAVLEAAQADPLVPDTARGNLAFAGFSFGSFVLSRLLAQLPPGALVIHGEVDDVVPLAAVLNWARPQNLPVVVLPGADHFFHRRLTDLKRLVVAHLVAAPLLGSVPGLEPADVTAD